MSENGNKHLEFQVPGPDEPGFLKRQKQFGIFMHAAGLMEAGKPIEPDEVDQMVEFLAGFVVKPIDPEEVRDLLWAASANEFVQILADLRGASADPLPEQNGDRSETPSAEPVEKPPSGY